LKGREECGDSPIVPRGRVAIDDDMCDTDETILISIERMEGK
jgi:hypothetical protein